MGDVNFKDRITFNGKLLIRVIHVLKIESTHTLSILTTTGKTKFPPVVQTALEEGGYPRHPVLKYETRLQNVCGLCRKEQQKAYYYVGDPRSDRKYDHGIICMKCYVRGGNDIIIKMRIEKL